MGTRKNYYYLRINENKVIDFKGFINLGKVDDYLNLNLLIAAFKTLKDLENTLKEIKLIEPDETIETIDIVKKIVKDDGKIFYVKVTDEPLNTFSRPFISLKTIKAFISLNKDKYSVIEHIVKKQYGLLESILSKRTKEGNSTYERYINARRSNMVYILSLIKNNFFDSVNNPEYEEVLDDFIKHEIYYPGDTNINYQSLIALANTICEAIELFKDIIELPSIPKIYEDESKEFRECLINNKSAAKVRVNKVFDSDEDPDHYMFLEKDDFKRELPKNASNELKTALETDLQKTEDMQKRSTL